jgi:hypothetical protein
MDSQQLTQPHDSPELSPPLTWEEPISPIIETARTLEVYQNKEVKASKKTSECFFMVKPGQGLVKY